MRNCVDPLSFAPPRSFPAQREAGGAECSAPRGPGRVVGCIPRLSLCQDCFSLMTQRTGYGWPHAASDDPARRARCSAEVSVFTVSDQTTHQLQYRFAIGLGSERGGSTMAIARATRLAE